MMPHSSHASKALPLLAAALTLSSCAFTNLVLNSNLMAVESGQFYRCGQMGAGALSRAMERLRIATVVNLRGPHPGEAWYEEERGAAETHGAAYHSLSWSMKRLPEPESLSQFVAIVERAERPILVHCQGGVHRAAAASAIYVLMQGGSAEEARGQFGLFFNEAPIGRLVDLYEGTGKPFAAWVRETYPAVYAREQAARENNSGQLSAE